MTDDSNKSKGDLAKILKHPEIVKIVVTALTETIQNYAQTQVSAGKPFLKDTVQADDPAVLGIIRLDGAEFSLELVLGFSKSVFIAFYENMFPMPIDEISSENHDLAGEILNIAFGAMDPKFRELKINLNSSFPQIFSGPAVSDIMKQIKHPGFVIPFVTADQKPFTIELYSAESIEAQWQYDPGIKRSA